jgi:hypothetical protein
MQRVMRSRDAVLGELFESGADCYLELEDVDGEELSDQEYDAVECFYVLAETVDGLPASLLDAANRYAERQPIDFQQTVASLFDSVGTSFRPDNATEFVAKLNALQFNVPDYSRGFISNPHSGEPLLS